MRYPLDHLTQPEAQDVSGPIQDDEALLLFALVRVCRCQRILEVGGLDGYSARNFLAAMQPGGTVYTVDVNAVRTVIVEGRTHQVITKDAGDVEPEDVGDERIDLVFFDCHDMAASWACYQRLCGWRIIDDRTMIAIHDTGAHHYRSSEYMVRVREGWMHQWIERHLSNLLMQEAWHPIHLHVPRRPPGDVLAYRHGLTVLQRSGTPLDTAGKELGP